MSKITILQALKQADAALQGVEEHRTIIYSLLSHCLSVKQEYLWSNPNILLTQKQFERFTNLVKRARNHEPLAYLTGVKEFYGRSFKVTQDVLIPRPESENIIELSVDFIESRMCPQPKNDIGTQPQALPSNHEPSTSHTMDKSLRIVDVGTGSGCLAITLALLYPQSTVYAIDVSQKALSVAKINANHHHATNVIFLEGSLLKPLQRLKSLNQIQDKSIDLMVANLPYISDREYTNLPRNIKDFEPSLALKSGPHPDTLNHQLTNQAQCWLKPNAALLYETTNGQIIQLQARPYKVD